MKKKLTTVAEAFDANVFENGKVVEFESSFVCPYSACGAYSSHTWGRVFAVNATRGDGVSKGRHLSDQTVIVTSLCTACGNEAVFANGQLVHPRKIEIILPHHDMPHEILTEYNEAALILADSPRGAAALLRLAVQKMLPLIGATKQNINDQIKELVAAGTITVAVQKALDSLRVIGNEAVHPGTMDLNDNKDTATSLFGLLNFIVEKSISEPKLIDEIFANLPEAKRQGIVSRDGRPADS
jgi:hypothetical protein